MLLRALLDAPDLRLRLLVGEDGLDQPVAGVYTTDLLDPRRYLSGGEIVLTGLMWRRGPGGLRGGSWPRWPRRAGRWRWPLATPRSGRSPMTSPLACRRHKLPLFEVPVDVSFAAITEQRADRPRLRGPAGPGPAVTRLRLLAVPWAPPGAAWPGTPSGAASSPAVFAVWPRVRRRGAGDLGGGTAHGSGAPPLRWRTAPVRAGHRLAGGGRTTGDGLAGRRAVLAVRRRASRCPAWRAGSSPSAAITGRGMPSSARSPVSWREWPPRTGPAMRRGCVPSASQPTVRCGGCWTGGPVPAPATRRSPPRCGAAALPRTRPWSRSP